MKNIVANFIALCTAGTLLLGCIEEEYPTDYAAASQVGTSETALESLSNSTAAFMYVYSYPGTMPTQEFGYPAMMTMRDCLTDAPYVSTNWNEFNTPWSNLADFSSTRVRQPWRFHYRLILNANNTIFAIEDPDAAPVNLQRFYGNALVYRAMSYLDLTRMFEYKRTGIATLDGEADKNELWGLTVPIVNEHSDGRDVDNNPRVPFYTMYRFILTDLNKAEKYLSGYARTSKNRTDVSVVHAYKARVWLEIATRFQKYPADLQAQLAHENDEEIAMYEKLNITSAQECYQKAAEYARLVMGKYSPLTEEQWHSTTDGFNKMSVSSWIFAISINSIDAVYHRSNNFYSFNSTEYTRGYSRSQYFCYRMIDKSLYDQIEDDDWRKVTWKDPADFNGRYPAGALVPPVPPQYHTLFRNDPWEWHHRDAYVGFKFRPNQGDISDDWINALMVDYPLIRVEEMYFIEAEAKTYTEDLSSGINALSSFLNTHRYKNGTYNIAPEGVDDFIDNYLITQKRIELWGEGLSYFDIKRRELALTRGYSGTNWLAANRYNSISGFTPSWLNYYIPNEGEASVNKAMRINPDPAVRASYGLWTGN